MSLDPVYEARASVTFSSLTAKWAAGKKAKVDVREVTISANPPYFVGVTLSAIPNLSQYFLKKRLDLRSLLSKF
ncbi:hypothetical protein ACFOJF_01980 [Pseudocitrobacter faecalis]